MSERLIKRGDEPKLLAFLVVQQSLLLAAGLGLWVWAGGAPADFIRFGWFDVLLGVALAVGMAATLWLLYQVVPGLLDRMVQEQGKMIFGTERPYGLAAILIISVTAGIGEEALFRGGIQTLAGTYIPAWAAILMATVLFALVHPGSRMFMSLIALVSLVFGMGYHFSGSLLAVMIAHALHDVIGCIWVQRELRRSGHWDSCPA